jgi:MFS-type transporter involved in bile tolerance (Atg22 family)
MEKKRKKGDPIEDYAFLLSAGFSLPAYAYLGYLAGSHLDKRFNTHPIFIVSLILALSAIGFYGFLKAFSRFEKRKKK